MTLQADRSALELDTPARADIYGRIEALLNTGTGVVATLRAVQAQDGRAEETRPQAEMVGTWIRAIERGDTFAQAIEPWVPTDEHAQIAEGEQGEGIAPALRQTRQGLEDLESVPRD